MSHVTICILDFCRLLNGSGHNYAVATLSHAPSTAVVDKNTCRADAQTWWVVPAQTCESRPITGGLDDKGTKMELSDRGWTEMDL